MKKTGSTLLLIVLMVVLTATTANAQFALEGGLNMANLSIKYPSGGPTVSTQFKKGAAFGLVGDIPLGEGQHVFFEPGLFYRMTGCLINPQGTGEYDINTVNIPLNIEYKSGEKCGSRFLAGIGPFISDNISGTYFYDASGFTTRNDGVLRINQDFKALDMGLGANIGYLLKKHTYLRLHYQVGIVNLNMLGDAKIKSSEFGATLGYLFCNCSSRGFGGSFGHTQGNHWRGLRKGRYSTRIKNARYPKRNSTY